MAVVFQRMRVAEKPTVKLPPLSRGWILESYKFQILEAATGLWKQECKGGARSFAAMNIPSFKPLALAAAFSLALTSCDKKADKPCPPITTTAPADEVTRLEQYLASAGISAKKDERGFFYIIKKEGSGDKPNPCSTVRVAYKGRLTTGEEFDSSEGVEFPLENLIAGWQEGIPLIAPGGSITLYLPPSLAYGDAAQQDIPANSILVFDIDLLSVE